MVAFSESTQDIFADIKRRAEVINDDGKQKPIFGRVGEVVSYLVKLGTESGYVNSASSNRKPHLIERLKNLVSCLEEFDKSSDLGRSPVQKKIHNYMVAAYLPNIFKGDDLAIHLDEINTIIDLEAVIKSILFILLPRRGGKTTSMAMFGASIMLTQPSSEGLIYSTGERASKLLAKQIIKYVKRLRPDTHFTKSLGEIVEIKDADGNLRTISCYPSNPQVMLFFFFFFFG